MDEIVPSSPDWDLEGDFDSMTDNDKKLYMWYQNNGFEYKHRFLLEHWRYCASRAHEDYELERDERGGLWN